MPAFKNFYLQIHVQGSSIKQRALMLWKLATGIFIVKWISFYTVLVWSLSSKTIITLNIIFMLNWMHSTNFQVVKYYKTAADNRLKFSYIYYRAVFGIVNFRHSIPMIGHCYPVIFQRMWENGPDLIKHWSNVLRLHVSNWRVTWPWLLYCSCSIPVTAQRHNLLFMY